jgi:nitrogen fixation/metabolism regulation signal transduction histidine kinase
MFISLRRIKTIAQDKSLPPSLAENLGTLEEEMVSLEAMSASFTEFARMPEPQKSRTDLNGAMRAAVRIAENESGSVRFDLELSPNPLMLDADREQLKRLFHNLIKNAVEASPENGVIRIRTGWESSPDPLTVVEITDQGEGMDPAVLKNLFQPYFTTKKKGTGLGLAIAQKIAEDHGGHITIRSEKGKGTAVRIVFG